MPWCWEAFIDKIKKGKKSMAEKNTLISWKAFPEKMKRGRKELWQKKKC